MSNIILKNATMKLEKEIFPTFTFSSYPVGAGFYVLLKVMLQKKKNPTRYAAKTVKSSS